MTLTLIKIINISTLIISILLSASCSQENHNSGNPDKKIAEQNHTNGHTLEGQGMHKQNEGEKEMNSIIHEGEIDLVAIDENNDGKVYQDQMCWNVLSDISGECPKCGMTLKEVTLEEAKKNLKENNYKLKNNSN
jgi:hypothetical protein